MEKLISNITSKEVASLILNNGIFEDYTIHYIQDIDGKFKCRLKQPWIKAKSGYIIYPMDSQILFDSKLDAIESCLIHIRSQGGLGYVKFDRYQDEEPKKKILKKKEISPEIAPEIIIKVEESPTIIENIPVAEEAKDISVISDINLENELNELEIIKNISPLQ